MPIYVFTCVGCGHSQEQLVRGRDAISRPCPDCSGFMARESVYHIGFTGFGRVPVDQRVVKTGAFMEASAEIDHQASKQTDIEGKPLPQPSLWKAAQQKAKRLQSLGVRDSEDLK